MRRKPWLTKCVSRVQVLMYGCCSATVGPFAFNASLVDMPMAFVLGCLLGVMQLVVSPRSNVYSNVFEVAAAVVTSFLARAIDSAEGGSIFCFSALAQSSIALILPGYAVCTCPEEIHGAADGRSGLTGVGHSVCFPRAPVEEHGCWVGPDGVRLDLLALSGIRHHDRHGLVRFGRQGNARHKLHEYDPKGLACSIGCTVYNLVGHHVSRRQQQQRKVCVGWLTTLPASSSSTKER